MSEWAFIRPAPDIPAETQRTDFWSDVVILEPDIGDMRKPFPCKELARTSEEVSEHGADWREICFMQFIGTTEDQAQEVIRSNPNVDLLGGAGVPKNPCDALGFGGMAPVALSSLD